MHIKTYRAANLQQALELVRHDLGPQAAILHTRQLDRGRIRRWLPGGLQFEVVASHAVHAPARRSATSPAARPALPDTAELARPLETPTPTHAGTPFQGDSPPARVQVAAQLMRAGFDPRLARKYLDQISAEVDPAHAPSANQILARLAPRLAADLPVAPPLELIPGQRRRVALCGPTGVGKTTTLAKLAAHFCLRQQHRVGLLSLDTYRLAAVDQLRAFADIMNVPWEIAATPEDIPAALARLESTDLVLIDTPGSNPRQPLDVQCLQRQLAASGAEERWLVQSAVAHATSLRESLDRCSTLAINGLVLTKLDEAPALAHLWPLLVDDRPPLRYLSTGQEVPDDLVPADATRVVAGMLRPIHA